MQQRYRVVRRHRQWDIIAPDLTVVEGGFFNRDAAEAACAERNEAELDRQMNTQEMIARVEELRAMEGERDESEVQELIALEAELDRQEREGEAPSRAEAAYWSK